MANFEKTLRAPLGRARHFGSAREGADENWRQRVTAAALIPLSMAFVWLVLSLLSKDYNGVRAELGHPIPAIALLLFVLFGVYHMQIGMRSIILDYVHGHAREWALIVNALFAAALALVCVYAELRIGFV
jgi:succinate dehydrogenase / fumarate reductase membrane anchor subunit